MLTSIEERGVDIGLIIGDGATTKMVKIRIKHNHDTVKWSDINRESYVSAHFVLNVLNELASLAFYLFCQRV